MNKPENQVCSDCPERQPRWASLIVPPPGSIPGSIPMGAFCCLECSGSHRRLGVHISFVRSVNLDAWKEKEVLAMENGGNKKVNAIFEARIGNYGGNKPSNHASGPERERFIRDKYERRKFFDASVLQQYGGSNSSSSSEESSEDESNANAARTRSTRATISRSPSDAARLRAENRRNRGLLAAPTRDTAMSKPKNKAKTANVKPPKSMPSDAPPAPPPAAPEVDLLDFGCTPMSDPGPPPNPPSAAPSPTFDLFKGMGVNDDSKGAKASPKKKMSSDDILKMFSTPSSNTPSSGYNAFSMPQNNPNTNMMGVNNTGNGASMGGGVNNMANSGNMMNGVNMAGMLSGNTGNIGMNAMNNTMGANMFGNGMNGAANSNNMHHFSQGQQANGNMNMIQMQQMIMQQQMMMQTMQNSSMTKEKQGQLNTANMMNSNMQQMNGNSSMNTMMNLNTNQQQKYQSAPQSQQQPNQSFDAFNQQQFSPEVPMGGMPSNLNVMGGTPSNLTTMGGASFSGGFGSSTNGTSATGNAKSSDPFNF